MKKSGNKQKAFPKLKHIHEIYWSQRSKLLEHVLRREQGEWEHDLLFDERNHVRIPVNRKVGRPRFTWLEETTKHVYRKLHPDSNDTLPNMIAAVKLWSRRN